MPLPGQNIGKDTKFWLKNGMRWNEKYGAETKF